MRITFIGGGNMGEAIISGIKKTNLVCNITVSEPINERRTHLFETYQVNVEKNNVIAVQKADLILSLIHI